MKWPIPALALASALLSWLPSNALAQADGYPNKPIHLQVGYAAGGATDVLARLVGQKLADALGQPVVVENRPGANGNIAAEAVSRAAPDGYTLFMSTIANTINTSLYPKLTFDFGRDFAPIGQVAAIPNVLVVHPSVPVKDVKELVALAKSKPGQLAFASSGSGSSIHLSGELFKSLAGVDMVHVPYKGSAPAMADLIGGQVQLMFDNLPSALPHIRSGKLRALAVTSATRSAAAPQIPTMVEAGLPGYDITSWFGLVAPAHTPREVVNRLNAELGKLQRQPALKESLAALGAEATPGSAASFATLIKSETTKWAQVVKTSGAHVD